jgi:hypothetical protein
LLARSVYRAGREIGAEIIFARMIVLTALYRLFE